MTTYRVTYVDSILRETIIEAATPEHAEDMARHEIELGKHHHSVDVWQDDWQAQEYDPPDNGNEYCWECGERRP